MVFIIKIGLGKKKKRKNTHKNYIERKLKENVKYENVHKIKCACAVFALIHFRVL